MKIIGIEAMTGDKLAEELQRGGKFVLYQYCISIIFITSKQPSNIYFIRAGESGLERALGFSAISFVLGWWGIPWGPIFTVGSIWSNLRGGKDVTREVLAGFQQTSQAPEQIPPAKYTQG